MTTSILAQLSDEALLAETTRVAAEERRSTADLLALLIEVERRSLHLALGCASLFVYCTRALRLSEQAAYSRITAARAARRFPVLLDLLTEGELTLSSVGLLAPHLTDENLEPLLEAARCKSTREVERLLACLHPQPDIAASLRAVPAPRSAPIETAAPALLELAALPLTTTSPPRPAAPPAPARPVLAPLGPKSYFLKLTIGQETHDKLQRVRALVRHSVPDGDLATIVDRALTLLLKKAERTKHAETSRPRRPARALKTTGRHVPASVKRAVWRRDGGSCAFIGSAGRCGETAFLEFHHVVPFAEGGKTDASNLELRCRHHNAHEAAVHGVP